MTTLLTGAYNFREVGGDSIPRHTLFRSDTLQALTPADKELVTGPLGIRCVLDLRSSTEVATEGRPDLPDICSVNIPLHTVHIRQSSQLDDIYAAHLAHDTNLPLAVEILATLLPRPTVVHCASGKDRTGIVVAIALGLAGASRETIVRDYLRSAPNMPRVIDRFRHLDLPADLFHCTESAIDALLDTIEQDYGGFTGWAHVTGVSGEAVLRLRRTLTHR